MWPGVVPPPVQVCRGSRWALRLVCKAGCSEVDNSVGSLSHTSHTAVYETREPVEVRTLRAAPDATGALGLPDVRWVGVQQLEIEGHRLDLMRPPQLPPRLAVLNISSLTFRAPEQERFAGIVALAGSLRQLQLEESDFGAGGVAPLADALSRLTNLQHLQLQGIELVRRTGTDDEALTVLAPALRCLTRLAHLELSGIYGALDCPSPGAARLSQSLAALTLLEVLAAGFDWPVQLEPRHQMAVRTRGS